MAQSVDMNGKAPYEAKGLVVVQKLEPLEETDYLGELEVLCLKRMETGL